MADKKKAQLFIAELPEVFGYGITGYGETPEEAEKAVRNAYFATVCGGGRKWTDAKEYFGFNIRKATAGTAHLDGNGDYVEID